MIAQAGRDLSFLTLAPQAFAPSNESASSYRRRRLHKFTSVSSKISPCEPSKVHVHRAGVTSSLCAQLVDFAGRTFINALE